MEAKDTRSVLPSNSFLVDRKYLYFDDFYYPVCLLTFGYYDEDGKLCYIYHLLVDGVFIWAFTDYLSVMSYFKKIA